MSSQKTKNYQLHAWEGEDKFLRTEMNENFAALDSAVTEVKSTAAGDLAAAKAALSGEISSASATLDGKLNSYAATAQTNLNSVQNSLLSSINAVSAVANGKIALVTGVCTGDGNDEQSIVLGFQPKAVLLVGSDGVINNGYTCYGGLALPGHPVKFANTNALEVTANGFIIRTYYRSGSSQGVGVNYLNQVGYYLAFA